MKLNSKRAPYNEINVTPMVDLVFVLLVIFILMTTAAIQGVKVNLPKASSSVSLAQPTTKAVTVDSGGQIYLDTHPVTLDELESELRTLKSESPEGFPVVIKGDRISQYGRIMEVLDTCGRVGLTQIGLVSERQRSA